MADPTPTRLTLRDLPLPAKLVVTCFLISVGIGYLWAMAQIHFKHASAGNALPTTSDLVSRFSGVPWPLEPRPEPEPIGQKSDEAAKKDAIGVHADGARIKSIFELRCVRCHGPGGQESDKPLTNYDQIAKFLKPNLTHKKGRVYTLLTGHRRELDSKSMVAAFYQESDGWDRLSAEEKKKEEPHREAERLALVAWIEAGAAKGDYESDRFALPEGFRVNDLTSKFSVKAPAGAGATAGPAVGQPNREKTARERWDEAKSRQLDVDKLTQSTHAHLLTFSLLWAATGVIFAFTSYSCFIRCALAPLVLVAQVIDVACWWLARLEQPAGPYFALAIMGTGAVVGLGLGLQIVLGLFNMYGRRGKIILAILFVAGAGLFGLTYLTVIAPQLQSERAGIEKQEK